MGNIEKSTHCGFSAITEHCGDLVTKSTENQDAFQAGYIGVREVFSDHSRVR